MGYVYLATCRDNGKQYIGKTVQSMAHRKWQHRKGSGVKGTGAIFYNAIKKHGFDNFDWEVLFESDDEGLLFEKEAEFVDKYGTLAPQGYNAISGGRGGWKMSEGTLAKNHARADAMSKAVYCLETNKVYKSITEAARETDTPHKTVSGCCVRENRKALKKHFCYAIDKDIADLHYRFEQGLLQLTKSPESVAKMKQSLTGQKRSEEFCKKRAEYMLAQNPFRGKKHSEASLKQISANRKGKLCGMCNPNARAIINFSTGELFKTISEAVLFYGLPPKAQSNISSCCSGKLKSAYGFHWKYADEDIEHEGVTL